jgi:hypothetical protein
VETSSDTDIAALVTARRTLSARLWDLNHTKRPRSQKKLARATTPLLAELQNNTVALRAAIVERVWSKHPDWRRARVSDQRQVMDLVESAYAEIISTVEVPPVSQY